MRPWQLLSVLVAGVFSERQQRIIEYLRDENRVLREHLGTRQLRLNDDQRRRLAAKGKGLGRKLLGEVCTIVTPDTLLRWHRTLIARTYDGGAKRRARTVQILSLPGKGCSARTWMPSGQAVAGRGSDTRGSSVARCPAFLCIFWRPSSPAGSASVSRSPSIISVRRTVCFERSSAPSGSRTFKYSAEHVVRPSGSG
jgi:hypothetical protein